MSGFIVLLFPNNSIRNYITGAEIPGLKISAEAYRKEVYSSSSGNLTPIKFWSSYVFDPSLLVFGERVSGVNFREVPSLFDDGIRLFGVERDEHSNFPDLLNTSFNNIYIPYTILKEIELSPDANAEYVARVYVECDYYGKHLDFFELRIVK